MALELSDYLGISVDDARAQFGSFSTRQPSAKQVDFTPVETLLCAAAAQIVDYRPFGSSSAHRAPEPVQSLARLFVRPPTSITSKMANVYGARSRGAKYDQAVGAALQSDPALLMRVYRTLLAAARAEGIDGRRLPDFLEAEQVDDEADLLGQEELSSSLVERELARVLRTAPAGQPPAETERQALSKIRMGQHLFAARVLANCGHRCVFCGLAPPAFGAKRMLLASHIKPWRDCDSQERMDPANGLAACPTHDVAFDSGLLTVTPGLAIEMGKRLRDAVQADAIVAQYFASPPLVSQIRLPEHAIPPGEGYLAWHRTQVFAA